MLSWIGQHFYLAPFLELPLEKRGTDLGKEQSSVRGM